MWYVISFVAGIVATVFIAAMILVIVAIKKEIEREKAQKQNSHKKD